MTQNLEAVSATSFGPRYSSLDKEFQPVSAGPVDGTSRAGDLTQPQGAWTQAESDPGGSLLSMPVLAQIPSGQRPASVLASGRPLAGDALLGSPCPYTASSETPPLAPEPTSQPHSTPPGSGVIPEGDADRSQQDKRHQAQRRYGHSITPESSGCIDSNTSATEAVTATERHVLSAPNVRGHLRSKRTSTATGTKCIGR
jgi:hypothetical protein